MADAKYDVLGIGNAIFDVLVQTDEVFYRHGMNKGGMALIDEERAKEIYGEMGPATEMSGGWAANTIVGMAGSRRAGGVRRQGSGRRDRPALTHDIRAAKIDFETGPADSGPATACSYILVTPDGERTMNTYLGAARNCRRPTSTPRRSRPPASPISKAISGIRRRRRRPSSAARSRTAPAARSR